MSEARELSGRARSPDELLDELGATLESAFRNGRRRRRRLAGHRVLTVAVAIGVLGVSTAAATQTILAPAPPVPGLHGPLGILTSGTAAGAPWTLAAGRCGAGDRASLMLAQPTGGAGSPCGQLIGPPNAFYGSGTALAFGAVPRSVVRVELTLGPARLQTHTLAVNDSALRLLHLRSSLRAYVVAIPPGRAVTSMTAFDAGGRLVLACGPRSCASP